MYPLTHIHQHTYINTTNAHTHTHQHKCIHIQAQESAARDRTAQERAKRIDEQKYKLAFHDCGLSKYMYLILLFPGSVSMINKEGKWKREKQLW